MAITFDPAKRNATFKDRGLAFEDAALVFAGRTYTMEDRRRAYPEARSDHRFSGWAHGHGGLDSTWRGPPRHLDEEMQCPRTSEI